MSELGKIIPLTHEEKELYSKLDFKYFLQQHIKQQNISSDNVELIIKGYSQALEKLKLAQKINKTQNHFFIEGYVRKMHSGGMLGTHFNLSEARSFRISRFEDYGENWAYFDVWAKHERWTRWRMLFWKRVVEIGAVLGFVLAAIHLYEIFKPAQ